MRRMQSVRARAPPPCADPPRVLVDDLHLVPSHDVMDVPLVKCASLQRIQDVLAPGQAHGGSVQAQADRGGRHKRSQTAFVGDSRARVPDQVRVMGETHL